MWRLGAGGVRQSVLPHDGLSDESSPQPHFDVGQKVAPGGLCLFASDAFLQAVGLDGQAVLHAALEELFDAEVQGVGLGHGGHRQEAGEEAK